MMGSVVARFAMACACAWACVCTSGCQPSARKIREQRDAPSKPSACTGHVAAMDVPPGWRSYPVVADAGAPTVVDVVDEGEGRREVDEVSLDRFVVRYARAEVATDGGTDAVAGTTAKAIGLMEVRERTCGEARIVFRPEWSGGGLHLRRRVLEYVVTFTPGDAASERPLAAFQWVRDPPKAP